MKILSYPHPSLTRKTEKWDFSRPDSKELLIAHGLNLGKVLESTPNGVALAANQVGLPHRFFAVREDFADQNNFPTLLVNPQIVGLLSGSEEQQEGCLSFPGMLIDVRRLSEVMFGFQTIDGEIRSMTLKGFPARMVQHEVEHLNGKTFIENVPRIERFRIMAEMKKRKSAGLA